MFSQRLKILEKEFQKKKIVAIFFGICRIKAITQI
jgi:hypothetical protein